MLDFEGNFLWSSWQPLKHCWRGARISNQPGLYQIRQTGLEPLEYIGQTSRALKKRLSHLADIYKKEMPYESPHIVGPALWALQQSSDCEFEVSVLTVQQTEPQWRLGLEVLAISWHRQKFSKSPTFNFGRMPVGYKRSSNRSQNLVLTGKQFRGGATFEETQNHLLGIPPVGPLTGDLQSLNWCGHQWSEWILLEEAKNFVSSEYLGLYRLRGESSSCLLYVGEGKIKQRLSAHLAKTKKMANKQDYILAEAGSLECSWVCNKSWWPNQRKELETDLIAAHFLFAENVPGAQFLGQSKWTEME